MLQGSLTLRTGIPFFPIRVAGSLTCERLLYRFLCEEEQYSRTAKRDTTSDDRARVYADAFSTERENCVFLYRMVMLLDKTTELTPEERVDRAFRYVEKSEIDRKAFNEVRKPEFWKTMAKILSGGK